ncbi:MAG: CNNM domain-containing protein [Cytophagales bacterium]|nr:CNNM domain-containing protein [Cytophagales bacterium]
MILLLVYLSIALLISFLCSIMEAVLLSTPGSFLIVKHEKGNLWAKAFMKLKENIDRPLSAILSLNTVAHTVGAAGVGAQAVKVFGEEYFGVVSAGLTILILIITEIIPKTIGARYWRNLAMISFFTIKFMIVFTYPLVLMSSTITKLISSNKRKQTTSREEIAALASIGADEGVFTEKEYRIIQNILRLKNVKVKEIMTPRVVVAVADEKLLLKDFLKNKDYLTFSRIPVYSNNEEHITGYVFRQTVFEKLAEDQHTLRLKDIKRDIVVVPNSIALFSLWEKLLEKKEHIASIVDEYGGLDGIVTLEDVIETLLGLEIIDEKDTIIDMQKYARERWETRRAKYNLLDQLKKQNE